MIFVLLVRSVFLALSRLPLAPLLGIALVVGNVQAQALRSPPVYARFYAATAGAASASTNIQLLNPSSNVTMNSQSVLIINDSTTDDAFVNLYESTAATTASGSYNMKVKAGEKINVDGQFKLWSYIRAGAVDVALRLFASY